MDRDDALHGVARAIDANLARADERWVTMIVFATFGTAGPGGLELDCQLYDCDGTSRRISPNGLDLFFWIDQLREATAGASDRPWDRCRFRFEGATGELSAEFHYDEQPPKT